MVRQRGNHIRNRVRIVITSSATDDTSVAHGDTDDAVGATDGNAFSSSGRTCRAWNVRSRSGRGTSVNAAVLGPRGHGDAWSRRRQSDAGRTGRRPRPSDRDPGRQQSSGGDGRSRRCGSTCSGSGARTQRHKPGRSHA